eukprot:gene29435-38529_t
MGKIQHREIGWNRSIRLFSAIATPSPPSDPSLPPVTSDTTSSIVENIVDAIPLEAVDAAAAVVAANPSDAGFCASIVMNIVEQVHLGAGLPYWEAIILSTVGLRICLLPIVLNAIRSSGRMAWLRPDMEKLQATIKASGDISSDPNIQKKYQMEMRALFTKHKVNPFKAMIWPIFQFPIFISFFMGLKAMGEYYPGFTTGGAFWFHNLSVGDPTLILPIINSLTFLIMLEIGADGVQLKNMDTFKMVMRGVGVAMVPLTMDLPQGLFVYWCTNNSFSIFQTFVVKREAVRKFFDIPKPPPESDSPMLKIANPLEALSEVIEKERSRGEGAKAEIIDVPKAPTSPEGQGKAKLFDLPPSMQKKSKTKL